MTNPDRQVCVLIAARNAAGTITRAVRSALEQPQVGEVVVVDDASTDTTAASAGNADDGSGRLRILRLSENCGPAAARNLAIDESRCPFLALLDADDFYLGGRFDKLHAIAGWDAIADNILFIPESHAHAFTSSPAIPSCEEGHSLSFEQFVLANISRRGHPRGELGFLKPVMRRAFLEEHGVRYNEGLRLGEDFDLYARMLACGARFFMLRGCGYVAVERHDSLSSRHRAEDLLALVRADDELLSTRLAADQREALLRHRNHVASKWHVRQFLDERRMNGLPRTLAGSLLRPRMLFDAAIGIGQDKFDAALAARRPDNEATRPSRRFLLPLAD